MNESFKLSNINPLDIPYIQETVFHHLSVWNLKKCRLISKSWHSEATPLLRQRCKISFKSESQFHQILSLFSHPSSLSTICQTFDISHEVPLQSDPVLGFFSKFSPFIKSLDLSYHHDYSMTWAQKVFPNLTSLEELCLNGRAGFLHEESTFLCDSYPSGLFSSLKFLFIYDSSYELDQSRHRGRIWVENIFHLLFLSQSSLERLFFAPFLEERARTFFNLLTSDALRHDRISHLHINHLSASPIEIGTLLGKQFPLKYVHLVLTSALSREDVNGFLTRVSATLRELTLTFTDGVSTAQFHPIQPLDNLTKLSLIGYEGALMTSSAKNLQLFVMSLPEPEEQLRIVRCGGCGGNVGESLGVTGLKLNQGLKELEIYDSKQKYVPQTLKLVFSHFHALRSLKMNNVDSAILRLVYIHLPSLMELHICFHKFYGVSSVPIDGGLCGIPEFRLGDELLDCIDFKDIDHLRTYPWIGGMKYLTVLELELGHVTDFGVILGIVRCCSIRKFILKNCDRVFDDNLQGVMTDLGLEAICNSMNLTYFKMQGYNDYFSEGVLEKCRKKMERIETYFL